MGSNTQRIVEVYIFNFSGDLYNQEIVLELISFLRKEEKFSNMEVLKEQIGKDICAARKFF